MGITVKQICDQFKDLKYNDLKILVGSPNFKDSTVISLNNFTSYTGKNATGIQTFVAKKDNELIELLSGNKQKQISRLAGIENNTSNSFTQNNTEKIPMGLSLFNIQRPKLT